MRRNSLFTIIATMVILILSSCSTAEFDENLKLAFNTMEDVFEECNEVNLTMKKIVDTSFQKSLEPQTNGKDILVILSEMANEQYDTYEREGVGKQITENLDLLRSQVAALKNAPISRKNCYNDFMEIVMEVSFIWNKLPLP